MDDVVAHVMPSPDKRWNLIRDITLFVVGMLGVIHETLIVGATRPSLLVLFAAMMGLPLYLKSNGK